MEWGAEQTHNLFKRNIEFNITNLYMGVKITIWLITDRETRLVRKSIIPHDLEFKIQTGADTSV